MKSKYSIKVIVCFILMCIFILVSFYLFNSANQETDVGYVAPDINSSESGEEEQVYLYNTGSSNLYGLKDIMLDKNIDMSKIYQATASSESSKDNKANAASNALDHDSLTYWEENAEGYGKGEFITFTNITGETQTFDLITFAAVEDYDPFKISHPAPVVFDVFLVNGDNETQICTIEVDFEDFATNLCTVYLNEPVQVNPGEGVKFVISDLDPAKGETNFDIGLYDIFFTNSEDQS